MTLFSEQINEISKALAKAQGEMKHASKESNNPFYKSKYADLAEVWNACRAPLAENGLAVVQLLDTIEGKPALITILSHASGQWIKSTVVFPPSKAGTQSTAQEIGSALTYFRRYCLAAIVGVYQDDDDNETDAILHRKEEEKKRMAKLHSPKLPAQIEPPKPEVKEDLTDEEWAKLDCLEMELRSLKGADHIEKLCAHLKIRRIQELPIKSYSALTRSMETEIARLTALNKEVEEYDRQRMA